MTKGADNVMMELCEQSELRKAYDDTLTEYSKLGLRTLAISSKLVQPDFFSSWKLRWVAAQQAEDREVQMVKVSAELERQLTLAGITAIEDKLQAGVPETIKLIKSAGVRFWVLTGDKTETAVEIARSCNLFTPGMK